MSGKKLWFGIPDKHMQWVPAPLAGANSNNNQFTETIQFENGGADARRSKGYHKSYEFEFNEPLEGSENLNVFNKFASGFYGDGLCVFADPYIFESNMFSAPWGTPWLVDSGWPNLYDGPPVISDLTGSVTTNLATNPSFETGSGTVEVRRNLAVNPSFETNTTSWNNYAVAGAAAWASTRETSGGFSGSAFFRGTATTTGLGGVNVSAGIANSPDYTAGQSVTKSIYVRSSVARTVRAQIDWFVKATTTAVSTTQGASVVLVPNTWTRLSVSGTVPATATTGRIGVVTTTFTESVTIGDTFDIDAYLAEISPTLNPYFDGSTSAGGDFTYAWTGTANASASVQNAVGVAGILGGSFRLAWQSAEWAASGSRSIRISPRGSGLLTTPNGVQVARNSAGLMAQLTSGVTYTAVAKFRMDAPQTGTIDNARGRRMWVTNDGGATVVASSPQAPNVAGQSTLSFTFVAPAGTSGQVALYLGGGSLVGGGDVWWDDFALIEGTYTGDYFDGATADTSLRDYAWTGTANASTSTVTLRDPVNTPAKAATWTITSAVNTPTTGGNHTFTIPVPPGYTLHVGASGTRTGTAVVQALPRAANGFAGTPVNLTLLDPNGTTRMNTTFVGSEELASVTFYLTRTTTAASTITLNSLMAQLHKIGTTPTFPTQHIPGEGHSGLEFVDDARPETYVYINPPRKALSTTLLEVGAWR